MLEMTRYTLNLTSQNSVENHKTPWQVYWSQFDPNKLTARIDHLWIPGTLCITQLDASHKIVGEKLDANGTRSVFYGYRGTKNKLVWLLEGGRFLISPHVIAYENTSQDLGWGADPREIITSLPRHVQDRLKARKIDYARNQDYNAPDGEELLTLAPRRRGRPRRIIQRPYDDHTLQVLNTPLEVDVELAQLLIEVDQGEVSGQITVEDLHDAVTGNCFGTLSDDLSDRFDISAFSATRKAIDREQFGHHSDGEELFRLMCHNDDSLRYILSATADELNFNQAMSDPEREN
ncbi:hypothetical protein K3495_g11940 [Podosphaera aphanis]|nr:hypothetical protein K3495_g11940 [Podosphaera aphanis]